MCLRIETASRVLVLLFLCLLVAGVGCGDQKNGSAGSGGMTAKQRKLEKTLLERLALDPSNADGRLALANLYYDARRWLQAVPNYAEFLKQRPDDADARTDLGTCYYSLKMYDKGRIEYERVLQAHPTKLKTIFNLAALSMETGDYERAAKLWDKVVMLQPESTEARQAKHLAGEARKLQAAKGKKGKK